VCVSSSFHYSVVVKIVYSSEESSLVIPALKIYSMLVGKSVSINHILPVGVDSCIFAEINVSEVQILFMLQPFLGIHEVSPAS
jgi:hypothetical protein